MTKIIKITTARIIILRDISTTKGLIGHKQRRRTKTAVDGFINARDIHSFMG